MAAILLSHHKFTSVLNLKSLANLAAPIAAWLAFIGNAPRLTTYGSSKARSMPSGFSFRITNNGLRTGPAFLVAVEGPTPTGKSGQLKKSLVSLF
jgi:hypothetical protein